MYLVNFLHRIKSKNETRDIN